MIPRNSAPERNSGAEGMRVDEFADKHVSILPEKIKAGAQNSGRVASIGDAAARVVEDVAFRRKVVRLHRQGPRVLAELLAHLAAERGIRVRVEELVEQYADLDADALTATGGDRFSQSPLREVSP